MHITLKQLETLAAVVHYGSLSRAKDALNISQPALSRSLSNLEAQLGIPLFIREKKRLMITAEGRIIAERAKALLQDADDLGRLAVDLKSLRRGRLCVVAIAAVANSIIPDCVAAILEDGANIEIAVRSQSEAMIVEWVATREADLGITMLEIDHPRITSQVLFEADAVCALPIDHPLAERDVIRPEDLGTSRLIRFCSDTQTRARLDQHLKAVEPKGGGVVEVYSSMSACELVRRKLGVAIVDPLTGIAYASRGEVAMRPFSIPIPYRFHLLQPRHRPCSALARKMLALIRSKVTELGLEPGVSTDDLARTVR